MSAQVERKVLCGFGNCGQDSVVRIGGLWPRCKAHFLEDMQQIITKLYASGKFSKADIEAFIQQIQPAE